MYLMYYIVLCSSVNCFFMNVLIPVVCIFFFLKKMLYEHRYAYILAYSEYIHLYKFLMVKLLNYGVYALKSVVGIAE